jgi:hypothetical protein
MYILENFSVLSSYVLSAWKFMHLIMYLSKEFINIYRYICILLFSCTFIILFSDGLKSVVSYTV